MNSFTQLISTEVSATIFTVEDRNEISFCSSVTQSLVNDLPEIRAHVVETVLEFWAFLGA